MALAELTTRQREVLAFLCEFLRTHQMPPTRRDIARHFGFASENAAQEHLEALERKCYIVLRENTARGIFINSAAVAAVAG
jgi:repressor LexA